MESVWAPTPLLHSGALIYSHLSYSMYLLFYSCNEHPINEEVHTGINHNTTTRLIGQPILPLHLPSTALSLWSNRHPGCQCNWLQHGALFAKFSGILEGQEEVQSEKEVIIKCKRDVAGNPHMFVEGSSRDMEITVKLEASSPKIKIEPPLTPKLEYPLPVLTSPDPNTDLRKSGTEMNRYRVVNSKEISKDVQTFL